MTCSVFSELDPGALPLFAVVGTVMTLVKTVAVAGGVVAGGFASGVLLRVIGRVSLGRQVPRLWLRLVQALGATGMGIAVYWAFGTGGWGLGGNGLGLEGKESGTSLSAELNSENSKLNAAKANALIVEPVAGAEVMRIEMLGGDRVKEGRFYLLEGEKEPRNLADMQRLLAARRQARDKPELLQVEIVVYEDSVAEDHPAVRELERWAKQNSVSVRLSKPVGPGR